MDPAEPMVDKTIAVHVRAAAEGSAIELHEDAVSECYLHELLQGKVVDVFHASEFFPSVDAHASSSVADVVCDLAL